MVWRTAVDVGVGEAWVNNVETKVDAIANRAAPRTKKLNAHLNFSKTPEIEEDIQPIAVFPTGVG